VASSVAQRTQSLERLAHSPLYERSLIRESPQHSGQVGGQAKGHTLLGRPLPGIALGARLFGSRSCSLACRARGIGHRSRTGGAARAPSSSGQLRLLRHVQHSAVQPCHMQVALSDSLLVGFPASVGFSAGRPGRESSTGLARARGSPGRNRSAECFGHARGVVQPSYRSPRAPGIGPRKAVAERRNPSSETRASRGRLDVP